MKIKDNINSSLEPYFENECLGFFQSLLFGNKNNLQQETKDLFKDTSISHVLAISGMHVGIVLISFENILKKVSQNKRLNYYFGSTSSFTDGLEYHDNSKFTIDEFGEKYGQIWLVGDMSEQNQNQMQSLSKED